MDKNQTSPLRKGLPNRATFGSIVKGATITFAVFALFLNDFSTIISRAIQGSAISYIFLVSLIFVYLVYRKRKVLFAMSIFENLQQTRRLRFLAATAGNVAVLAWILHFSWDRISHARITYTHNGINADPVQSTSGTATLISNSLPVRLPIPSRLRVIENRWKHFINARFTGFFNPN